MKYLDIKTCDINNGDGVRVSLWVAGCHFHCKGCHNKHTWDFNQGKEFTNSTYLELVSCLTSEMPKGLTIIGGEPLAPSNYEDVLLICKSLKEDYPEVNIWIYTGYYYDELVEIGKHEIFDYIDVLVDGRFEEELKDESLEFRGSSNQRIWRF